jgi:hypothetical protein
MLFLLLLQLSPSQPLPLHLEYLAYLPPTSSVPQPGRQRVAWSCTTR